jgi:geranylgeranyl transferase type-2 subunit beta
LSQIITSFLRYGIEHLSTGLKNGTADYVVSRRREDGGYPGRCGGSDPYYTDFALRILSLVRPEEVKHPATLAYADWTGEIADIPECFNRLSIAQLCEIELPRSAGDCLNRHRLLSECYRRSTDSEAPSAYCTFLGTICEEMLGLESRKWMGAANRILELQSADGGFSDTDSGSGSQTNPTSAATGYLAQAMLFETKLSDGEKSDLEAAIDNAGTFLLNMQAKGGGFLALAKASYPDLLSTFTALAALASMNRIKQANLREHAQFVGSVADADGGFRSCMVDTQSDIEYTHYGLGCLALIAFAVKTRFD